jgi:hypothetical protein
MYSRSTKYKFRNNSIFKNIHKKLKIKKGFECHHWNYNKTYEYDIIILDNFSHKQIHAKMFLDIEHLLYRDMDCNLLDTKEKHENYIKKHLLWNNSLTTTR